MHVRGKYTDSEAELIFISSVQAFMQKLAARLSEVTSPVST